MKKILLFIIMAVSMPTPAFSQDGGYGHMNGGWHMMHYGYGGIFIWLLLIVAGVLLVYLAVRLSKDRERDKIIQETPLDILKKRYAKGEINKEEFEQMKQDLQS